MVILTIGMVLFFALVYFLANAARKALQRLRCPPWANLLVIVGICIAMFAGGTTGLFALMIRNGRFRLVGRTIRRWRPTPPTA